MTNETTASVQVYEAKEVSFLDNGLDLKKLLRDITKHSKAAVEVLVQCIQQTTDKKMQLTAALKLLELQTTIAKDINDDQLRRLIAEIKVNRGGVGTLENTETEKQRPLVDFENIRSVED